MSAVVKTPPPWSSACTPPPLHDDSSRICRYVATLVATGYTCSRAIVARRSGGKTRRNDGRQGGLGSPPSPCDDLSRDYLLAVRVPTHGFLSAPRFELFNWLQKRFRPPARLCVHPSYPDKMTNTGVEAIASSSGNKQLMHLKNRLTYWSVPR